MKTSARNMLQATVQTVTHGAVNSEITVELPNGQEVVSIITKSSAERLGLEPGKPVTAMIKASNVMLVVED